MIFSKVRLTHRIEKKISLISQMTAMRLNGNKRKWRANGVSYFLNCSLEYKTPVISHVSSRVSDSMSHCAEIAINTHTHTNKT